MNEDFEQEQKSFESSQFDEPINAQETPINAEEIQQANQADQSTMAVINALLNDIYGNAERFEIETYVQNKENLPLFSQRITDSRQRNVQMFELQDDVIRTRTQTSEIRKLFAEQRRFLTFIVVMIIISMLLCAGTLASLTIRNLDTEQHFAAVDQSIHEMKALLSGKNSPTIQPQETSIATQAIIQATPIPTQVPTLTEATSETMPTEIEPTLSPADQKLEALIGQNITLDLPGNATLFSDASMQGGSAAYGTVINAMEDFSAILRAYTADAINIEFTANIGRSQISEVNNIDVRATAYVRRYSNIPGETTVIFQSGRQITLVEPVRNCTDGNQSFCHGRISVWLSRSSIEDSIN